MKPDEETITVFSTFPRVADIELPPGLKHVPLLGASYLDLAKAYRSEAREERCFLFNGLCRQVWAIALLKMLLPEPETQTGRRGHDPLRAVDLEGLARRFCTAKAIREGRPIHQLRPQHEGDRGDLPNSCDRGFCTFRSRSTTGTPSGTCETGDDGYIVVAGQTRRDFDTFRRAIEELVDSSPNRRTSAKHALPTRFRPQR